jgi:hypothetical protein
VYICSVRKLWDWITSASMKVPDYSKSDTLLWLVRKPRCSYEGINETDLKETGCNWLRMVHSGSSPENHSITLKLVNNIKPYFSSIPIRKEELWRPCVSRLLNNCWTIYRFKNRDISVGIAIRLWAGRSGFYGSIPRGGWELFTSLPHSERHWGPPSFLPNGYQGLFPWGKAAEAWNWPFNSI